MTEHEKQKVVEMINGMTAEELWVAVSVIDTQVMHVELLNRALKNERKIQNVKGLIENYEE